MSLETVSGYWKVDFNFRRRIGLCLRENGVQRSIKKTLLIRRFNELCACYQTQLHCRSPGSPKYEIRFDVWEKSVRSL
ncbi:hypothetical protein NQ318_021922, partial [Aromia moschata]